MKSWASLGLGESPHGASTEAVTFVSLLFVSPDPEQRTGCPWLSFRTAVIKHSAKANAVNVLRLTSINNYSFLSKQLFPSSWECFTTRLGKRGTHDAVSLSKI